MWQNWQFFMAKFANFCGKIWQNLGFQMAIFCDARMASDWLEEVTVKVVLTVYAFAAANSRWSTCILKSSQHSLEIPQAFLGSSYLEGDAFNDLLLKSSVQCSYVQPFSHLPLQPPKKNQQRACQTI